jgi:hypothetical protein
MDYRAERCGVAHLRAVARSLRHEEVTELAMSYPLGMPQLIGRQVRHVMFALWRQSPWSLAFVCGDGVIAVVGDSAPLLCAEGRPWLFTTTLADRFPLAFFCEARDRIRAMLAVRHVLRASILATSTRSARFYDMLGFTIGEPQDGLREIRIERG